ncbi:MAG: nucleotidyltransferase family protein [Nitrospinaceae bacterium]|jgi:molybdenum cofactor cytidylyltransferase|nr:nucleotidyltransferase family protein [Nitrospinaceae bacterium]MBT3435564.1 nucleotidyltransferase family protein [Nitrospinaceae bacterium]MBT3821440.1 nucleotidyltransferase family protein [Nitrospinaceae bacterium]MBT4429743.1 nucleotidyltransferase family protein [Nitrospinaceae bacterium]MBT5368063.1 nucleotidyltransferase family protein [Nitrospinaceae bacterium]
MTTRISAILLAAGLSSRLGRNKLLASLGGKAAVRRVAEAALASKAAEVVVVTGHEREGVEAALAGLSVTLVHNPDFESGQASSLVAGVRAAAPEADGYLFALGDQPLIGTGLIDELIEIFALSDATLAAAPVINGRRGNPALISASLKAELEALRGDEGARGIIKTIENESPSRFMTVVCGAEEMFWDIDTEEDFERVRARIENTRKKLEDA